MANTTGTSLVAIGYQALNNNTTGSNNTAVGLTALAINTFGASNTAVGKDASVLNTTGSNNSSLGENALRSNTTGASNTGLGSQALYSNTTASGLTAIGYQAGYSSTTGYENVFLGYQAGYANTTGYSNTFLGHGAGNNITTGFQNIYIGRAAIGGSVAAQSEIVIGFAITGKGNSTGFIAPSTGGVYQGNNSSTWSTTSDQRLKKNIADNNEGLGKINSIRVRNFEYRLPEEITDVPQNQAIQKTGVQLGVIAQELQQVLPECVKTESTGVMSVDTDNLIWYAINAIKELKAEVDSLKSQLNQGA